jgi:hypothetical protein
MARVLLSRVFKELPMELKNTRSTAGERWTHGQYEALGEVSAETLASWSRSGSRQTWKELQQLQVHMACCAPLSREQV